MERRTGTLISGGDGEERRWVCGRASPKKAMVSVRVLSLCLSGFYSKLLRCKNNTTIFQLQKRSSRACLSSHRRATSRCKLSSFARYFVFSLLMLFALKRACVPMQSGKWVHGLNTPYYYHNYSLHYAVILLHSLLCGASACFSPRVHKSVLLPGSLFKLSPLS